MKLCSLAIKSDLVCEVTAEYPLLFSLPPKLNKTWLREVLSSALRSYFLRRSCGKFNRANLPQRTRAASS